jgi:hypothetical protein
VIDGVKGEGEGRLPAEVFCSYAILGSIKFFRMAGFKVKFSCCGGALRLTRSWVEV